MVMNTCTGCLDPQQQRMLLPAAQQQQWVSKYECVPAQAL